MTRRLRASTLSTGSRIALLTVLSVAVPWAHACDSPTGPTAEIEKPRQTDDGWQTAGLEAVGMDPAPLEDLLDLIDQTESHMMHCLLIARHQKLVMEEYWSGTDLRPEDLVPLQKDFDREELHYVASVSKSVTSALAGIALDQGVLAGVDGLLFHHFPEHQDLITGEKGSITLRHLLSFSSGYEWNEFVYGFHDPRDSHNQMFAHPDPIRYLLARPVTTPPGEVFHYNSGDTNLVGEIVRRVSSSPTLMDYAEEHLFQPLGIDTYEWETIGPNLAFASGGISLRPRDMAKFGQMYLDGGWWNGRRVVPEAWVERSVAEAIPLTGSYGPLYGYGYNWWLGRFDFRGAPVEYYRAAGWGGQDLFVIPSLDLIVVFTAGGYFQAKPLSVNTLIQDYIFPAIVD